MFLFEEKTEPDNELDEFVKEYEKKQQNFIVEIIKVI
jgi:hypothetical protein